MILISGTAPVVLYRSVRRQGRLWLTKSERFPGIDQIGRKLQRSLKRGKNIKGQENKKSKKKRQSEPGRDSEIFLPPNFLTYFRIMPIHCPIPIRSLNTNEFGKLDYRVMAVAFECHKDLGRLADEPAYANQLGRLLRYSPLRALHWVNVSLQTVTLTTIKK